MLRFTLDHGGLAALILELRASGYRVVGPTLAAQVIRFGEITSLDDLPAGWTSKLAPGSARIEPRSDHAVFGYVVGPNGLKEFLFPPRRTVWRSVEENGTIRFVGAEEPPPLTAIIGARACDLAAMGIQDRVFRGGSFRDPDYVARRRALFVVAVNCTVSAPTCFCTSLHTGPAVTDGFDLSITEVIDEDRHVFVGETGSEAGEQMLGRIEHRAARTEEVTAARYAVAETAGAITRVLQTEGLRDLLAANPMAGRWNVTAQRCLACGNCTQVCPTCFCVSTEDDLTLDGSEATKSRRWDSCFSLDFSFMGGRPMRSSIGARYRQWLTHKLSSWVDQFGELGCVGCGRCITWCPVGIDLTEEVAALRATESVHV